jgi:hypothetical protein
MLCGQRPHCLQHVLLRIVTLLSRRASIGTSSRGQASSEKRRSRCHGFSLVHSLVLYGRKGVVKIRVPGIKSDGIKSDGIEGLRITSLTQKGTKDRMQDKGKPVRDVAFIQAPFRGAAMHSGSTPETWPAMNTEFSDWRLLTRHQASAGSCGAAECQNSLNKYISPESSQRVPSWRRRMRNSRSSRRN